MKTEAEVRRFLDTLPPTRAQPQPLATEEDVRALLDTLPPAKPRRVSHPHERVARWAGQALGGMAQGALNIGAGIGELGAAAARGVGELARMQGQTDIERDAVRRAAEQFAEARRRESRLVDVALPAETTGERVARGVGRLAFEGASFAVPGGALSKAPAVAALPRAARFGIGLAADVPIDVAIGAGSRESSTAGALADLTDSEWLERVAADPGKRAAFEALTGAAAASVLTGAVQLTGATIRAARRSIDLTPDVATGLQEGIEAGARELEGGAEIGRVPYSDPDALSAEAAALRRARAQREAARIDEGVRAQQSEAEAQRRALELEAAPAPGEPLLRGAAPPEPGVLAPPPPRAPLPIEPVTGYRARPPRVTPAEPGELTYPLTEPYPSALYPPPPPPARARSPEIQRMLAESLERRPPEPPDIPPPIETAPPRGPEPPTVQPDIFGAAPKVTGELQGTLLPPEPQTLAMAEQQARATLARLSDRVQAGAASPEEVGQVQEAMALLRRGEAQSAEEVALGARARQAEQEPPDTGELFAEPPTGRVTEQAVARLGTTTDPGEGTFILADGQILKGRATGGIGRHTDIADLYPDVNANEAVLRFMDEGNLRINVGGGQVSVSSYDLPTPDQLRTIRRIVDESGENNVLVFELWKSGTAEPIAHAYGENITGRDVARVLRQVEPKPRKTRGISAREKYGRALSQATREEAEIAEVAGRGAGQRRKVDYADPGLTIGSLSTGAGVFAKGRRTQALNRAKVAKELLGKETPDPDIAILEALEADPLMLPAKLAGDFAGLKRMADDDLLRSAQDAEDFAYRNQDNDAAVMRRAILAGEAKRRGLMESRPGMVDRRLVALIARTGVGAATGAALSEEDRLGGAVAGAAVGAGAPALVRAGLRGKGVVSRGATTPDVDAVLASVARRGKVPLLRKLTAFPETVRAGARSFYAKVVDETQPLRELGRALGGGEKLSHLVSQAKGWRGGAQQRLDTLFRDVVTAAKGNENNVTALATAERALELARAGMDQKGVDLAAAQRVVDTATPETRAAVDQLRAYYRSLLDYKLANGVITQEAYDAITASGEYYVPFVRDFGEQTRIPGAGGGRLVNRGTGVRKMTEERARAPIVDPFEQAVLDTFEAHRTVAKQRVTNMVAALVEADPATAKALGIRKLVGDQKAKLGREVQANVGGTRERYEVADAELFNAWAAYDNRTQSIVVKLLSPLKRTLQTTVTLMPDFAIRNMLRDNAQSAIQYRLPVPSALSGAMAGAAAGAATDEENRLRGAARGAAFGLGAGVLGPQAARVGAAMGDIVGNRAVYQEFLREGGSGFSEFYARPADAARLVRTLRGDRSVWDSIRLPVEGLQSFGRMIEEAPRLARYKAMRKGGADVAEAVASARDISLDFANIGSDVKGIAATTAFFNAKVQGWDKLARLLKNPKTWGVGAATLTAPSIALWSVNQDDPEYWARPQWERNLFWLIPNPAGGFFKIPKPFEVGFIFASLPERILDYMHEKDPETLRFALKDMASTTAEGTFPIPTGIEPVLENVVNYDFFTNRPVVAPGLERLPEELQYDNRTAALSRLAAKLPGLPDSPQKTENILRGYTGNVGREVLDITDQFARSTGLDTRPQQPQGRTPIVGSFVTREDATSDQETTLRRRYAAAEKVYQGAKTLVKRGDKEGAREFVRKNREVLAQYPALKEQKRMLDKATEARRAIVDSDMDPRRKRELLVRLNRMVAEMLAGKREAVAAP